MALIAEIGSHRDLAFEEAPWPCGADAFAPVARSRRFEFPVYGRGAGRGEQVRQVITVQPERFGVLVEDCAFFSFRRLLITLVELCVHLFSGLHV